MSHGPPYHSTSVGSTVRTATCVPGGHVKLADVSRARADSEEPSIASSAFIRDSFALMVDRVSDCGMCRWQGKCGTLGPFDAAPSARRSPPTVPVGGLRVRLNVPP